MMRILNIPVIVFMLFLPHCLTAQIKSPVVEDVPDVKFNASETSEKFKAAVTIYGKGIANGEIILTAGVSVNASSDTGRIYPLRDINRITITKWLKRRKGTGWFFYPDSYEIILKDRSRILHDGNLEFLNRLRFVRTEGGEISLFTYFYDYFRNGKWVNTGTPGEKNIPSVPAAGTVYIIELK